MKRLEGRVAIVTGAGRGLGREHALLLAQHGAAVVVNDLGSDVHGRGEDITPACQVVQEIRNGGGEAIISGHDVADWGQAAALVRLAVEAFGDLHVLVNNAGILRDRTLANMTEAEWDAVIRVHLKGHAAPTRHALAYRRDQFKAGKAVNASVIHTSSVAGFAGNFGQANYASAKLAVAALSQVVVLEAGKYGIRSNVVSPAARTRITEQANPLPLSDRAEGDLDRRHPGNVSPLIAWLADANCPATGQVFHVDSNRVLIAALPTIVDTAKTQGRWTLEALDEALPAKLQPLPDLQAWFQRV